MSATVLTFPLPDGPLTGDHVMTARAMLIERMARDVIKARTYPDHADSVSMLVKSGHYARFDIMACIDDVMTVVAQHLVATEMSEP